MYEADDPSDGKPMLWPDPLPYDDPRAGKIAEPSASDLQARPTIQTVEGYASPLKMVDGRLRGLTLEPRVPPASSAVSLTV